MAFNLKKPPSLDSKHDAYPYQLDAVMALKDLQYAAIFHEQGLGKTKIALDIILYWLTCDVVDTVFIVTKKTLVHNWRMEIDCHSHVSPRILSTNRRLNGTALNAPVLIYVLNYEVISNNFDLIDLFLHTCRVGIVLDESQKIKNPNSKLTKNFLSLSSRFARRLIVTGTPSANRPFDIWSQIFFLDGGQSLGDSFDKFKSQTDLPKAEVNISKYSEQLAKIANRIKPFSIRKTKNTAGIELPNKAINAVVVEMASRQREIYCSYRDNLSHQIKVGDDIFLDDADVVLKRLLRLVQCASNPSLLDDRYSETPGKFRFLVSLLKKISLHENKAIIWTEFIDNVEWLCQSLAGFMPQKVHGTLSIDARNQAIDRFKNDNDSRLMIATPGSAKEGLTLTAANHAIFYDRGFSLDNYIQAQDRIHRISQTKPCVVHNLIAKDTIDEWVDCLLNAKFRAAQLAQDDISEKFFRKSYNNNLTDMLKQVLSPN